MENLKKFMDKSFKDPISHILLKHSNLTKVQYETLLIDLISDKISEKRLTCNEKALFRSDKVSRGSFSRTLSQARRNIISAVFTILLLSYIGVFEEAPFDAYHVLSERLKEYVKMIESADPAQAQALLKRIEKELIEGIRDLARPRALKIT